ncbi:hypothetical protein ID866_9670 [Astraeus odoratus]|nr:hypothetical protein ID866_9670 [Astraeus odoratus]
MSSSEGPQASLSIPAKRPPSPAEVKRDHGVGDRERWRASVQADATGRTTDPEIGTEDKTIIQQGREDRDGEHRRKRHAAGNSKSAKGNARDKRNVGRRRRTRETTLRAGEGSEARQDEVDGEAEDKPKAPRLPKRQTALLLGFCGTGCSGMQMYVLVLLVITQHQAFSCGMDWVTMLSPLYLPIANLISGLSKACYSKHCSCDSRKYTYFFPTYLLLPPKPGTALARALNSAAASAQMEPQNIGDDPSSTGSSQPIHPFWGSIPNVVSTTPEEDLSCKRRWRVGSDVVEALRVAAKKYEGIGTCSIRRYGVDQCLIPWTELHASPGASFMPDTFTLRLYNSWKILYGPRMVMVPKMPALGLLLEYPIFETYNKRIATSNEKLDPSDADFRPEIDFEVHRSVIDEFKQKYIYDNMRNTEDRCGIFDAWIRYVDSYEGNDLLYLNPKGIIPATAVIKKGIKRLSPFKEKKRFDITSLADIKQDDPSNIVDDVVEEDNEESLSKGKLEEMEG